MLGCDRGDGDDAGPHVATLRVDLAGGPARLAGLAPVGAQVPEPGSTTSVDELRVLALPGRAGGTAALVLGLHGRTVLWAPAAGGGDRLGQAAVEALADADLDAAVLDLSGPDGPLGLAGDLAALRRVGALTTRTDLVAIGGDRSLPPNAGLLVRLRHWGIRVAAAGESVGWVGEDVGGSGTAAARVAPPRRCVVLGPAASGKSELAEDLLAAEPEVLYLATGSPPDETADPDWAQRVRRHRRRRPATWRTEERAWADAAAGVLTRPGPPVLLDSVGGWVTGTLGHCGAWDDMPGWRERWESEVAGLVQAWHGTRRRAVAVAEETGWGVVPQTAAGRLFRDRLGELTRRLAGHSDQCLLVVAGRVLDLDATGGSW